jgi:hypothetical protein
MLPDHCQIVAGEMKQLLDRGVAQQAAESRGAIVGPGKLHEVTFAIARRQLHQTQPIALGTKPHRFGIHRHDGAEIEPVGQVLLVQVDRHVTLYSIWVFDLAATTAGPSSRGRASCSPPQ